MIHSRPIHHICYVVDDIPAAARHWARVAGAGPFLLLDEHVRFEETLLGGEPCVFDHASAIGRCGPQFIELIALHEVTPALAGHLGADGGISHIAYLVDDAAAENQRLDAAGLPTFLTLREGPVQITVHDAPLLGHGIEVHENGDAINGLFQTIAAAAEGWDGREPLRAL